VIRDSYNLVLKYFITVFRMFAIVSDYMNANIAC